MLVKEELNRCVIEAWELYFARQTNQFIFKPSAPILFFGNYLDYRLDYEGRIFLSALALV
jgi:hypothetical protein